MIFAVACEPWGNITNGYVKYYSKLAVQWKYNQGTWVYFACNSGYVIKGHTRTNCNKHGRWSRAKPRCEGKKIIFILTQ